MSLSLEELNSKQLEEHSDLEEGEGSDEMIDVPLNDMMSLPSSVVNLIDTPDVIEKILKIDGHLIRFSANCEMQSGSYVDLYEDDRNTLELLEKYFENELKTGYHIYDVAGDGNCGPRAVAGALSLLFEKTYTHTDVRKYVYAKRCLRNILDSTWKGEKWWSVTHLMDVMAVYNVGIVLFYEYVSDAKWEIMLPKGTTVETINSSRCIIINKTHNHFQIISKIIPQRTLRWLRYTNNSIKYHNCFTGHRRYSNST